MTAQTAPTAASWSSPIRRSFMPVFTLLAELILAAVVIVVSIEARDWIDGLGRPPYQEFLRFQWLLFDAGKGLHLDPASLPIPPLFYVTAARLGGPTFAEDWLPIALNVAILLVLTRLILGDRPLSAKLFPAILLVASPLFYLLQRQLDVQLYVLFLGLQLMTLRSFRQQPSVLGATSAILVNILLSLTTYMALPAIVAAIIYLLTLTARQPNVRPAVWSALMWLYVPFSFAGYLLWGVFWAIAGSRITTSYFIPSESAGNDYLRDLLSNLRGDIALPVLALVALVLASALIIRRSEDTPRDGRAKTLTWAVVSFMAFVIGLVFLQTVVQRMPLQLEVLSFSLMLLIPVALGELHIEVGRFVRSLNWGARLVATGLVVVIIAVPVYSMTRPDALRKGLPSADARQTAEEDVAAKFAAVDPGGRILLDPRFAATFAREANLDPARLVTPFDAGFESLVLEPPADVKTIVVTDSLNDAVAGNFPAMRYMDLLPDATLIAESKSEADGGTTFVRVFRREEYARPATDLPFRAVNPEITQQENTILAAIQDEMTKLNGLPLRPDGYAYAVDMGNLMVYSARRGDMKLFTQMSDIIEKDYLTTKSNDPNALYTVAWRHRPGKPNDASGTTETLRMVEAYWTAGERWNNEYYRRLAYMMALAYAKHQWSDEFGNGWFIRNYYNYETKEYATNTYLVDYSPDVLYLISEHFKDAKLRAVADEAARFVLGAQLPSGLLHEMYQPEISTLYANITYFSPNGIIQLIDSIESIIGVADIYAPERAQMTYDFAKGHFYAGNQRALSNQYNMYGIGSEGVENAPAVYAYLIRLGVRLGDTQWPSELIREKLGADRIYAGHLAVKDDFNWFFAWTSSLVALREYQETAP